MKTWTWKERICFGLVFTLVISIIVLYFVQLVVSYTLLKFACYGIGIIAFVTDYLFGKFCKEKSVSSVK